jgi:hypothetical protein
VETSNSEAEEFYDVRSTHRTSPIIIKGLH